MIKEKWPTAVTNIEPNKIQLRGYPIEELMGNKSFVEVIWLALRGELPGENEGKMLEAILTASIDHGVTPPSVLAAMTAAGTGAPVNAALAAGILSINKYHGGAIENCMKIILYTIEKAKIEGVNDAVAARRVVVTYRAEKKRMEGFGHRYHTEDPRRDRLFALADEYGSRGSYIDAAIYLEEELIKQTGKELRLNVDGAIGAVLLELGFEPEMANAFFIMARIPGLLAHISEEWDRFRPMRKIIPDEWEYDGEPERHP
ncbi:MAG: citryl-CoA lyase [bacterium]|nr:citryl-CoA lyase [bacterium]